MFELFEDFIESDTYEEYEEFPEKCVDLIEQNIVSPKVGLEFYVNTAMEDGLDRKILLKLFNSYNLDINGLYDLSTDSNLPTTLLNSLCEYRLFDDIKTCLEVGADPNIEDTIHYRPFQSLMSGHSATYIGKNAEHIKTCIELFLKYNTKFTLEKWQYEEHYKPYEEIDNYFVEFKQQIEIIDNINNRFDVCEN
jgi:hypothetical protein